MSSRSFHIFFLILFFIVSFAQSQVNWQRYSGNPVVPTGTGTPAFQHTYAPSVLFDSLSGIYKMWFSSVLIGGSTYNISYATSVNGTNWEVYSGSPVLRVGPSGSFDSQWAIDPYVLRVGSEYRMYYTGYDGTQWQTGLAVSTDGINWVKNASNPILRVGPGLWESIVSGAPKVHYNGSTYTMVYSGYDGTNYNIGIATSTNGTQFTKHPSNPVLRRGNSGEWDANAVVSNAMVYHNGTLYLFFTGGPYAPIGFATSTNGGLSWTKSPLNPTFTMGSSGSWDADRLAMGSLMVSGSQFRYWYSGYSNARGSWQIGYATGSFAPPTLSDTVAYYRLDEPTPLSVLDSSPYRSNGTAVGTTVVAGRVGSARNFNGAGDYILIPYQNSAWNFSSSQSFTIDAWFRTTQTDVGDIVRRGLAPLPGFAIRIFNGRLQGIIGNREDGRQPDTLLRINSDRANYNDGQWHNVKMIRDRGVGKLFLYVDGEFATAPLDDPFPYSLTSDRALTIGAWQNLTVPTYFRGTIDEVQIFKGARHPAIPISDTSAIWRFDETSGSLARDDSPNRNDGTAFGTTIVAGRFGNARQFNGLNSHVWVNDPFNGSLDFPNGQNFTIEAWFKTTSLNNQQILRKGLAPVQGYELKTENGRVVVRIGNREDSRFPDTLLTIRSTNTFNDGNWHKATIVRDQTQRRLFLYVDGILAAPSVFDPIQFSLANDRPFTIGKWENDFQPVYFNGTIDEIRIYRSARHGATAPTIQLERDAINFGIVPVGTIASQLLGITNLSFSDTLFLSSFVSNNTVFLASVPLSSPVKVPPSSSVNIPIMYTPAVVRTDTGTLTITSNDPNRPTVRVRLNGQGFTPSASPLVASVRDIPEDQGKQVRVIWHRSIYDGVVDSLRITQYNLWRRVGNTNLWDFIATIPAVRFEQYAFVAPTLFDSSRAGIRWSVFRVSAHTANNLQTFFSVSDSGYSVDNLPPLAPTNLIASLTGGRVQLNWDLSTDPDVEMFGVYRSTDPNFIPSEQHRIGTSVTNNFLDMNVGGSSRYYYHILAFDTTGNQSAPSNQASVFITGAGGGDGVPTDFRLYQNYPNPFNPSSTIRFDLPERAQVNITVYDMMGRIVATLVDETRAGGKHSIVWNAARLASGVYLYRLQAGSFVEAKRTLLLK